MNNETKITNFSAGNRDDWRKSSTRFTVHTDGKARDIADREYFSKHNIIALDFRCYSWDRVGGLAARIEARKAAAVVEAAFNCKVELTFSRTAGCSCGCSPGFVGKIVGDNHYPKDAAGQCLSRATVWLDVPVTAEEEAEIVAYAAKQALKLPAEIEAGNAKVAAAKAERERVQAAEEAARQARIEARTQRDVNYSMESACL